MTRSPPRTRRSRTRARSCDLSVRMSVRTVQYQRADHPCGEEARLKRLTTPLYAGLKWSRPASHGALRGLYALSELLLESLSELLELLSEWVG